MDLFADWLTPFLSTGSLLALPLVVLGGLITAFNPCCLPMYPAVFGVIGGSCCKSTGSISLAGGGTSSTGTTLFFVLGMAVATSMMGILTAGFGWVFGHFNSWFLLFLALIPLFMGLSLLVVLPFRLPFWRRAKLCPAADRKGGLGGTAFGAGLLFSLAIAPCATPILLGILTLVAMRGEMLYGGILMFVYGLGAGLPLLLIGKGFDRAQHWLMMGGRQKWLRTISGVLLIGTSAYIIWSV